MITALFLILFHFSLGNKITIGMINYVAHFDRRVGIYIATKLFQFTSREVPSNPSRTDGFFRPCSRHRVRPSCRDESTRGAVRVI